MLTKKINIDVKPDMDSPPEIERPDTPRAKCYSQKDVSPYGEMKNHLSRKRKESETTLPETHADHESGKHNIFHSIKSIINEETEKEGVEAKIPEEPEIRRISSSDGSVSDHSDSPPKSDFSNKKLEFLFKLYDQRRASGVKPAMKYKFRPNVDIFEADSDHPAEDITKKEGETLKSLVDQIAKKSEVMEDKQHDVGIASRPDSMKVEYDECSSEDPDDEEIARFESAFRKAKEYEELMPKGTENFNTKEKMNEITSVPIEHSSLQPGNPRHNEGVAQYGDQSERERQHEQEARKKCKKVYKEDSEKPIAEKAGSKVQYEDQAAKEIMHEMHAEEAEQEEDSLDLLKKNQKKTAKSSKHVPSTLKKKRIEVFMPFSPLNLKHRKQQKSHRDHKKHPVSRNTLETLHRRQPELFETIEPWKVDDSFHNDAEEARIEDERNDSTDYEGPNAPHGSPINIRTHHPQREKPFVGPKEVIVEKGFPQRKPEFRISKLEAIELEDNEDPMLEEELSSE